jgi:hypothetical protein
VARSANSGPGFTPGLQSFSRSAEGEHHPDLGRRPKIGAVDHPTETHKKDHRSRPCHLPTTRRPEANPHAMRIRALVTGPRVDGALLKAIVRAYRWREMLERGEYTSAAELAKAEKVNDSYLSRIL